MPSPGDTLVKRFTITDASGDPLTNASFSDVSGFDPTGTALTPDDPTHLGNGIYELSIPTLPNSATGPYYVRVSITLPYPQVFEFEWDVTSSGIAERWKPGDTLMDRFTVLSTIGAPLDNTEFNVVTVSPDGRPFPVAEPTSMGDGVYQVTYRLPQSARPGSYYIQVSSTNLYPRQVFGFEWVVGRGPLLTSGHTLRSIRRMVMARFGDIVTAIATENGSPSLFIDEDNLYGEPGRYAGREIMFLNGANAGQHRYITGSSRSNSSIDLARALPFPTSIGDEADITNAYGLGVTFRAVRDAINYAIAVSRQYHLAPMVYEPNGEFDPEHGVIPVPVEMVGVERVEGVHPRGHAHNVRRAPSAGTNGWFLDNASHSVVIRGNEAREVSGFKTVIHGYTLPHDLIHDDDTTTVDIEWLVDMATSHICLDTLLSRQTTSDWGSKGMLYKQNAERLLSRLTPNLRSSFARFT